jgi:hypothetical protein
MGVMREDRRYVRIELPGETIVMDVPAVPPVKRLRQLEPTGCPTNMIYATAEDMKMFRPSIEPGEPDPGT